MSATGHPIIALVCSTGGLDALRTVLAPLPADLPAAVIALQHLAPDSPAMLPGLLARDVALPVAQAEDGDQLHTGRVLIAPAGRHILISADGTVTLIPVGPAPPYRPSADLLLTTLAIAYGRRVVAVVLTGKGNDAATGATAVHHFGGTVIATSTETSTAPAMPEATINRDSITDHVVALGDVAPLLLAMATLPVLQPSNDRT